MKRLLVFAAGWLLVRGAAFGQAEFTFLNIGMPTRIGSVLGPVAGTNIWAQMLAGTDGDHLAPVGVPARHFSNGVVYGGYVAVPAAPYYSTAYVQMVAWDGDVWGSTLSLVPDQQVGRTDIVPVFLVFVTNPHNAPQFTQPAVVPIPEPGAAALVGLGLALLALRRRSAERGAT